MIICKIFIILLNIVYFFMKLMPTKQKKIFFLSRQSNSLSLDYKMLIDNINKKYPDYKIVVMTGMIGKSLKGKIKYIILIFIQMYHLATSKTCVIDGYNVSVSILKHKKALKIIQLWHSLGAIKKFGYQTLNKEDGNSYKLAKVMKMHNNYDLIVTGSKKMIPYFSEAFNQNKHKFINSGLPRIDYLLNESIKNKAKILKKYPYLKFKKVILYVPTFRKTEDDFSKHLEKFIDKNKYEFIIKIHPLKKVNNKYDEFSSLEWLSVADYVITDYSAISLEACILNKPLYFYLYDLESYNKKVGINIDLNKEMPKVTFNKAKDLIKSLENGNYPYEELNQFKNNYIDNLKGNATDILVNYIIGESNA